MLLNESVPAVLCLASSTGLPKSLKSVTAKEVLRKMVGVTPDDKSKCLASCDVSILSRHPTQLHMKTKFKALWSSLLHSIALSSP